MPNEIDFKKEPRSAIKVGKMLQSLFTIFAVTKLNSTELDGLEQHILNMKFQNCISDTAYGIEAHKIKIARDIVVLIEDIQKLSQDKSGD